MTRKEAIKVIRNNWPDSSYSRLREALETLIPELKESEDEKTRKEIISALKFANVGGVYNKHIAYLERQKPSFKQIHDGVMYGRGLRTGIELEKQQKEQNLTLFNEYNPDDYEVVIEGNATSLKRKEQKYDGNMDKECIKLCNTLNSIPSVDTFESCCGHLKDSYSVWFFCNDIIAISRLGRCVERNYSDGKWELLVDSTDTHPTGVFWLRSKVPFQSYDEMEESVNELCVCIQYWFNTKFDSYFNNNACK